MEKANNLQSEKDKIVQRDWDIYWGNKKSSVSLIYDTFAGFYRKMFIRSLDRFMKKTFSRGESILHAGCGSGMVDVNLTNYFKITALDISPNALKIYKSIHKDKCKTVQGSIFKLPFKKETFDGIYNLGVMEHFTEEEINKILSEFYRVLKPHGKIVIFWPPVFGLSVRALDSIHFVMNDILKRNIKLHPDEITRIKSREHAEYLFRKANFRVLDYYFGMRDMFTQTVIVAEKKI